MGISVSTLLQKAFGHHHNKREKIIYTQESSWKKDEKDYKKILVIGEEMVELQANTASISRVVGFSCSVLGDNYSLPETLRPPPQQKRENRTHVGEKKNIP
jgi:mannosyltransferase OCH1-like enzyme